MVFFTYQDFCKYKASVFSTYNSIHEDEDTSYTYSSSYDDKVTYSINDVHDKLYIDFFNDNMEFSLFLKQFLDIDVLASNLINCNSNFVTEDLNNRHSDIVYKLKDKPIYFFLEH